MSTKRSEAKRREAEWVTVSQRAGRRRRRRSSPTELEEREEPAPRRRRQEERTGERERERERGSEIMTRGVRYMIRSQKI
tara:strand:- start:219 stop:458 length:240 start_codon:yes stop_codon:yes gene_type:complete